MRTSDNAENSNKDHHHNTMLNYPNIALNEDFDSPPTKIPVRGYIQIANSSPQKHKNDK